MRISHGLEWVPNLSGCYRPLYYSNPESHGTENNLVRPLEPVIFMVSEKAYDILEPGYENGRSNLQSTSGFNEIIVSSKATDLYVSNLSFP